ncbi:MAG: peptidylprolyl isomerase [Chloroflexi bacterium]|nr:peptidylprolyl isomerase [Chloroflexota bacterium]
MNHRSIILGLTITVLAMLVACGEAPTTPVVVIPTNVQVSSSAAPAATPTPAAKAPAPTAAPQVTGTAATAATPLPKSPLSCPPQTPVPANAQLAARVNGVGIPLDLFNRQMAQAQDAMVKNFGTDPKSPQGQEALKSLRQQVLDQLINDVVIAQYSESRGIKVTDNDLNTRIAQMIQDAGSVDKLNEYMTKQQMTLADLCLQVRNQILGDAALNDVTAPIPTQGEQVHVRHILVDTPALGTQVRDLARKPGADFAALAKQYSKDETSKANGGDLGWVPRGVLDPRLEAVIFDLPINQVSDVVTTQFGYHVAQVLEKEKSRPLPPEVIQNVRQDAFLKWLQAMRENIKIERLVQP